MIYVKRVLTEFNKNEQELTNDTLNKICSWKFNEIGQNLIKEELHTIEFFYSSFVSYLEKNKNNDISIVYEKIREQVRSAIKDNI